MKKKLRNKQWIYVRGNVKKEILLFLHGGPGMTQMHVAGKFLKDLENDWLIVDYDQRGAGKSYSLFTPLKSYKIDRYVEDILEVVLYVKETYKKEKVYLCGHSWGSMIGILAAKKYPEHFHAFIGIGQVIDTFDGNKLAYNFILNVAKEHQDHTLVNALQGITLPSKKGGNILRNALEKYHYGFYADREMHLWRDILKDVFKSKIYNPMDKIKYVFGLLVSLNVTQREVNEFSIQDMKHIDVPVFFIQGERDYISPTPLVEDFMNSLRAPHKDLFIIKETSHYPHYENPLQFAVFCLLIREKGVKNVINY